MKTKIKIIIVSFIMLYSTAVFADVFTSEQNLSSIEQKLPVLKDTKSRLSQEKYIPTSNISLKSFGEFVLEKDKGVTFYTLSPIRTSVSYSNNYKESDNYKHVNNIVKAISSKSYTKLEHDFKFYYMMEDDNWILGLKPKLDSKAINHISKVVVYGNSQPIDSISKIVIETTDETVTTISFLR